MQLGRADPLRDRFGERGGDVVHVGEPVGERGRQLAAGRALGDARPDRLGQRELAAQVMRLARADAEVGADGGDPLGLGQAGARLVAVAELLLLVGHAELLAAVLLGLDAADLLRSGGVVEQQHDQARDRRHAGQLAAGGERVAGAGGQQPPLAGVEDRARRVGVGAVADAGDELAGAAQQAGEALDPVRVDLAALVGGELEVVERDALEPARQARRARRR